MVAATELMKTMTLSLLGWPHPVYYCVYLFEETLCGEWLNEIRVIMFRCPESGHGIDVHLHDCPGLHLYATVQSTALRCIIHVYISWTSVFVYSQNEWMMVCFGLFCTFVIRALMSGCRPSRNSYLTIRIPQFLLFWALYLCQFVTVPGISLIACLLYIFFRK